MLTLFTAAQRLVLWYLSLDLLGRGRLATYNFVGFVGKGTFGCFYFIFVGKGTVGYFFFIFLYLLLKRGHLVTFTLSVLAEKKFQSRRVRYD